MIYQVVAIDNNKIFFIKEFNTMLNEQKNKFGRVNLEQKTRKVKKIYPYTSSKQPVNSITQNCFGNMACPITIKITKKDYGIRRLKSQQSTNMNYYIQSKSQDENRSTFLNHYIESQKQLQQEVDRINEEFSPIAEYESPSWSNQFPSQKTIQNQESLSQFYCQLVTRQGVYFCEYKVEGALKLESRMVRPEGDKLWYLKLGTPVENILPSEIKLQIYPEDVAQIFYRKFNQITNNSLEFFMKNGTSKFISFYRREFLATAIKKIQKTFKGIKIIKDVIKQFEQLKFMQKWVDGHLSNFDYLMLVNKYSGRTYNDLNQYYVFPWILKDYKSKKLDLSDANIYRDLSKPIGALNPEKYKRYQEKYINQKYNSQRCLYGSHYSTSLFLFYYLVRVQPYSSLRNHSIIVDRQMQKDNWDVADRLFNSVEQVWQSLMCQTSGSDIKECIPQFYYMPAFLRNIAHIQLGQRQCGSDVSDVELPPWAKNAQDFIVTMRAALQSDYVSQNLHNWIDLIFGKYQNSEQKSNIFHPFCYSDPEVINKFNRKDYKNIDGIICQISYFGQCPLQLFKKQHKSKKTGLQLKREKSESVLPQKIGQVSLANCLKIFNVNIQHPNFCVQIQNERKGEKQMLIIPSNTTLQGLKQNIENILPLKKSQSRIKQSNKITINKNRQLFIGKEFIMDIDINFQFQNSMVNQLWIACYGVKGICIYNWQLELNWSWKKDEVAQVYLQPTRLIFSTANGKLYFYSFLTKKLKETIVFQQIFDMSIKVMRLPSLPLNLKNNNQYSILCIGDGKRLSIIHHYFEEQNNINQIK